MGILSMVNPLRITRGIQFLKRCAAHRGFLTECMNRRGFVEHCFIEQGFLLNCFSERAYIQKCLDQQGQLKELLKTRIQLGTFALNEGSLPFEEEVSGLRQLVEQANGLPGPIIEIGTLFGHTTSRMAVWKIPAKKIITVDSYVWNPLQISSAAHQALTRRFLHYLEETGQVEIIAQDKNAFYAAYQGERPALVFLDADHTYEPTQLDIQWARRIGARIIAGHDYGQWFPGVKRAVDEAGGPVYLQGSVWALATPDLKVPSRKRAAG